MLKADRIGLTVVLAALTAIGAMVYLVLDHQVADRLESIRNQGVSLVRALSGVPLPQLSPGGEQQGVVQILKYGADDNSFAYVSIVDVGGNVVHELAAKGVIVPAAKLPAEPAEWLGETQAQLANDGRRIIEFHAPLLESGELQGFVRLGYLYPHAGFSTSQIPFVAAVSLPVFLLAPLFYLLLRLEVRPIRDASEEMNRVMEGESFRRLDVVASGTLGDFMQRFNSFVDLASSRINALEKDQNRLVTSKKLLSYRKNRVETVLETLPEAILILDESGAVTFANRKLAAMFDVSRQVILTQPPQNWCNHPDVLQLLARYQSGNRSRSFTDTVRFSVDAVIERSIATRTFPLFSVTESSQAIGTLMIFRDETQEAMARQARADFVGHLSHELKSPLNILAMYSESLLSEHGRDEAFRVEAANVISDEVHRLSSLVSGLLSMTQIETGSLAPERTLVKLREVAEAAFEEARHSAADRDVTFSFDAPKEMNPVYVDKDLIQIAITNLLSNAVKYNRDGGDVSLTIEETADAIQLRVADSGIGVSDEEQARIFDKFYRSPDERVQSIGGHGLGLSLTRQIIELHQGSLTLNHERSEGAEFIINLWKESTAYKQAI